MDTIPKRGRSQSWTWNAWCRWAGMRTAVWPVTKWDKQTSATTRSSLSFTGACIVGTGSWNSYDRVLSELSFLDAWRPLSSAGQEHFIWRKTNSCNQLWETKWPLQTESWMFLLKDYLHRLTYSQMYFLLWNYKKQREDYVHTVTKVICIWGSWNEYLNKRKCVLCKLLHLDLL